jgi:hypothetical protein
MKFIARDNTLFDILIKEHSIADSSIIKINIFVKDYALIIEIDLKVLYPQNNYLRLRFLEIEEYSFYHKSNYFFYNVERYKLIKTADHFFISFDPEDEKILSVSENDQDSISFGSFEGYSIDSLEY